MKNELMAALLIPNISFKRVIHEYVEKKRKERQTQKMGYLLADDDRKEVLKPPQMHRLHR